MTPSKQAEMLAEIEHQGYKIVPSEFGWQCVGAGDPILPRDAITQEEATFEAFQRIFMRKKR